MDRVLGGGLWKGALTEISTPVEGKGGAGCLTVLSAVLRASALERRPVALVDAADGFDPQPLDAATLAHLLWVRCQSIPQFLKAADLILRDGNLQVVLMDLRGSPRGALRKIPNTTWYRLQRIAGQSAVACMIATPWFMVSSAQYRVEVRGDFRVGDLEVACGELCEGMGFELVRRHGLNTAEAI
jgi:hypothetical protein